MKAFNIFIDGSRINVIKAKSYDEAFKEAVRLYGLSVDIEEVE